MAVFETRHIYDIFLLGISDDPPLLKFSLEEIQRRIKKIITEDETMPAPLNLSKTATPDLGCFETRRETIDQIPLGTYVIFVKTSTDDFWYVNYNGKLGYVLSRYLD